MDRLNLQCPNGGFHESHDWVDREDGCAIDAHCQGHDGIDVKDELDPDWGIGKTLKRVWIEEGPGMRTIIGVPIEYGEDPNPPRPDFSWSQSHPDQKFRVMDGETWREPTGWEQWALEGQMMLYDKNSKQFRQLGTLIIRCLERYPEMEGLIKILIDDRAELDRLIEYNRDKIMGFKGD